MEPNFGFQENSCFLQFWECCANENSDENGCYFLLTDQLSVSNIRDNRLEAYRWTCLNDKYRFVGREKNVGDWFAGRAAQTQVADYQYNSEALGLGQLVMPVYFNHSGAVLKLAGIIELVTAQHNEFYAAYFNQIQSSLMEVNLTSTYLGKTIKVEYNQQLVKFTLPFSANLPDLQEQVTMRFKELENKAFSVVYKDTNHIRHSILSDHDLQFCIAESILNRTTLIRMDVVDVLRYLFCVNKVVHEEFKLQEFVKSVVAYQKKLGSTTKHRKGDAIEAVAARITYRLRRSMEVKSIYEVAFKSSYFRNWGYNLGLEVAV
ncbi:hypothetical protein Tco_0628311 [Tanacetum coccineum]|uniref:Uncharacterized protein n=1 Tax=Tanacetum coccineum TaxID=301880 RepID=A0ABQ4WPY4_9ASTR